MRGWRRVAGALMHANVGGFLTAPPGLDGRPAPLGIAGIHGVPRAREWDAVASARAPGLTGDRVHFVSLRDGTILVDEDVPDGAVFPLADAIETVLQPPYRAVAVRGEAEVWSIGADETEVIDLPQLEGDELEAAVGPGDYPPSELSPLEVRYPEGFVVRGRRLEGTLWEVDVTPL